MTTAKKIWIDLDNSPHVLFFRPIIRRLEEQGYQVLITARDCSQVCGLAEMFDLEYRSIGKHYGKNKAFKVTGAIFRSLQLAPVVRREKPDIAISHGSRSQLLLSRVMKIPSVVILDYEHVKGLLNLKPRWIMAPEIIDPLLIGINKNNLIRYPGIKEDVYIPYLNPDPSVLLDLGIDSKKIIATLRPPASDAHYHNRDSDALFDASVKFLSDFDDVQMIILPRTEKQKSEIQKRWTGIITTEKVVIPEHVIDALSLCWYSDFVISGGGTMNRESAAMDVPVYSIFKGKIGCVDRYLAGIDKLILIDSPDSIKEQIKVEKRVITSAVPEKSSEALNKILESINTILKT